MGIPRIESAESFKQRMIAERTKKISDSQRNRLSELDDKITQADAKKRELTESIQAIHARVEEHRRIVSESQAIKDDLSKQRTELSGRVSQAQAVRLEMRRNIEQAHSQELVSIRKIVNELRTEMKKKP
jgi:uncharacterized coiled-coil DUF342 family protein